LECGGLPRPFKSNVHCLKFDGIRGACYSECDKTPADPKPVQHWLC